eukprot:215457_1
MKFKDQINVSISLNGYNASSLLHQCFNLPSTPSVTFLIIICCFISGSNAQNDNVDKAKTNKAINIISIVLGSIYFITISIISTIMAYITIKNIYKKIIKQFISNRPYKFIFWYSCIADNLILIGMFWWFIKMCLVEAEYPDASFVFGFSCVTFSLWVCLYIAYWLGTGQCLEDSAVHHDCCLCCNIYVLNERIYLQRKFWCNCWLRDDFCNVKWLYFWNYFFKYGIFIILASLYYNFYDFGDYSIKWWDFYGVLILLFIKICLQIYYTLGKEYNEREEERVKKMFERKRNEERRLERIKCEYNETDKMLIKQFGIDVGHIIESYMAMFYDENKCPSNLLLTNKIKIVYQNKYQLATMRDESDD